MCRMQKIYLSQLLVLLGIPLVVLFAFLLGGFAGKIFFFFVAFSCLMAALILEVLARHHAILNERDRQIRQISVHIAGRNAFPGGFGCRLSHKPAPRIFMGTASIQTVIFSTLLNRMLFYPRISRIQIVSHAKPPRRKEIILTRLTRFTRFVLPSASADLHFISTRKRGHRG